MKKTFFFAVLAVALAAFGLRTGVVHAQTAGAGSTDTASLEQQLDVAKATLVNLEMQAGMVPQGDDQLATGAPAAQPAAGRLPASEVSYFTGVLSQLSGALTSLNATLAANPSMSQAQVSAIASTLGEMRGTVSAIATQIAQDEANGATIAANVPSAGSAASAAGAGSTSATSHNTGAGIAAVTPATTTPVAAAQVTSSNAVQTTAQASSIWSFTKNNWPVLLIIVLVIAILAILFWPDKEAKAPTVQKSAPGPSPKSPVVNVNTTANTGMAHAPHDANASASASVVAPPGSTKVA